MEELEGKWEDRFDFMESTENQIELKHAKYESQYFLAAHLLPSPPPPHLLTARSPILSATIADSAKLN